jgi:hypothetical protein
MRVTRPGNTVADNPSSDDETGHGSEGIYSEEKTQWDS